MSLKREGERKGEEKLIDWIITLNDGLNREIPTRGRTNGENEK